MLRHLNDLKNIERSIALLFVAIFVASCDFTTVPTITRQTSIELTEKMSLKQSGKISKMAVEGVLQLEGARKALNDQRYPEAVEMLDKSRSLFNQIEQELPYAKVTEQVWSPKGVLTYENVTFAQSSFAPIFTKDAEKISASWIQEKDEILEPDFIDRAVQYLIHREFIEYGTVGINLDRIEETIANAEVAMDAKDMKTAKQILTKQFWLEKNLETAAFKWPAHKKKDLM